MEALSGRCGKGLLAAGIGACLALWTAAPAQAESLNVRLNEESVSRASLAAGSSVAVFAPLREQPRPSAKAGLPTAGNLLTLFVAGTVLFGDSPSDFTPSPPPPPDNPPAPTTPITPSAPTTPTTPATPKDGGPTIQGNPTPEPASLVIGLLGSACVCTAVLRRRRKPADAA